MKTFTLTLFSTLTLITSASGSSPNDTCWPSNPGWELLNNTVSGRLIKNTPIAAVCYPGPLFDAQQCAFVDTRWSNSTFQADQSIGYSFPIISSCLPVNSSAGEVAIPGTCTIGDSPWYTINATEATHVRTGVLFAKANNLRLVVKNTGHDLLGSIVRYVKSGGSSICPRSTGFGSLEIWIRHLRKGIIFQQTYVPSSGKCSQNTWTGSAFVIGGGYAWSEVYAVASARSVVVVGGGDPTVGCLGGWMQGGGHSPASRNFGLGADQLLEATVVLASGQIVTASACQNQKLFFALRGGGGGTYGIVTSATVKAHPSNPWIAQVLTMAPFSDISIPDFMKAVAIIYGAYPDLNDGGFSGYGAWAVGSPTPVFANFTTGLTQVLAVANKSLAEVVDIFAPTMAKLVQYNETSLDISVSYIPFPSYQSYYSTLSGVQQLVGTSGAVGSRLLDRRALTTDPAALAKMLNVTAGKPGEFTVNNVCIVGGGQVTADASDKNSGVNPAWRTAYIHNIVARGWALGTSKAGQDMVHNDITFEKVGAMKELAPNTGSYMNEADARDPDWRADFFGANLDILREYKALYDPDDLFYCPTCVGSEKWAEKADGSLCMI
ncbi:isoamyl alcohol oxidase [Collybia nuda]|uniref:Isoamyl alcohol oxidase n=1 Tax=Collybia nuda TaxID=64659 RepID=A0A9P6CD58_9AGAR|nr:isoamyl alcohol oxidase [Collybia nuda]